MRRIIFGIAVIAVFCSPCGEALAERFPAAECRSALDALWNQTRERWGWTSITKLDEWGEGTIDSAQLIDAGTRVWFEKTHIIEYRDDKPITPEPVTLSISFTDSAAGTLKGDLSGNAFLQGISAELNREIGEIAATPVTHSTTISVGWGPRTWQEVYVGMLTIRGKRVQATAAMQPWIRYSAASTGTFVTSGSVQTFTHTAAASMEVKNSGVSGTKAAGVYPPDPPSPTPNSSQP